LIKSYGILKIAFHTRDMSKDIRNKEINIIYKFDVNYNPSYSNGAYGGVYETGELIINFYTERMPLPNKQTYKLDGDNLDVVHEPEDLKDSRLRFVHSGIIMNYQHAKELHRWLGNHLKSLEESQSNNEDD